MTTYRYRIEKMSNTAALPEREAEARHLLPAACYVCGGVQHPDGDPVRYGHSYWSNVDAAADFAREDSRLSRLGFAESSYVDQTRGR